MQRILSAEQMRLADKYTIETLGVSQDELVLRAGTAVAEEIKSRFFGGRVLVCVGKGNNGKDGLVVADILSKTHGYNVTIFNAQNGLLKILDKKFDIIIDCIFGTGLNKTISGNYKRIIDKINSSNAFVISCDIASGLNGDTGEIMGTAVKANLTIAIQEYKLGHFLSSGIDYSGEVVCRDIGISIWDENVVHRIQKADAKKLFEVRNRNVHKGSFGKACVIGGSKSFSGSVLLSLNALCSLKAGAGYSYLAVPKSVFSGYIGLNPECILTPLEDDGNSIVLDKENLDKLMKVDAIAIGMGMTCNVNTYQIVEYLLNNYTGKLIIDADAINCLSEFGKDILKNKKCSVVLTPHIGEFSRLIKVDKQTLKDNAIELAKSFAKEYGVTLLLKSAVSIITDGEQTFINTTGSSGMAKAGSGDVLSGFMAGVLARAEDLLEGVTTSAYVFGVAGELAQKDGNEYTITATDLINYLPKAINRL